MVRDKKFRFQEFVRRLADAHPAETLQDGLDLIATTLNAVEDEFSGVPSNPESWRADGRMYPPLDDSIRDVPGHVSIKRFRSRAHNTFIGANGAIEIRDLDGNTIFEKYGKDGRGIGDI